MIDKDLLSIVSVTCPAVWMDFEKKQSPGIESLCWFC